MDETELATKILCNAGLEYCRSRKVKMDLRLTEVNKLPIEDRMPLALIILALAEVNGATPEFIAEIKRELFGI